MNWHRVEDITPKHNQKVMLRRYYICSAYNEYQATYEEFKGKNNNYWHVHDYIEGLKGDRIPVTYSDQWAKIEPTKED